MAELLIFKEESKSSNINPFLENARFGYQINEKQSYIVIFKEISLARPVNTWDS